MFNIHTCNDNFFMMVGDIHGEFNSFVYHITNRLKLSDLNIIVCGDFGMGFHKQNYYTDTFKKLNKKLKKNNIHIYGFRGNHDDPEYFHNDELKTQTLNGITNIHLVDDYDIVKNNEHQILCVGGARSVDKSQRWKIDYGTGKKVYTGWWEGEMVKDIPEGFNEFIHENNILIDIVCSHSSPDFCEPLIKRGLEYWAKFDDTVIEDCDNERKLLSSIYERLKTQHNIKYWFYGHFHNSYILINNGVLFRGLNMFNESYKEDFYTLCGGSISG